MVAQSLLRPSSLVSSIKDKTSMSYDEDTMNFHFTRNDNHGKEEDDMEEIDIKEFEFNINSLNKRKCETIKFQNALGKHTVIPGLQNWNNQSQNTYRTLYATEILMWDSLNPERKFLNIKITTYEVNLFIPGLNQNRGYIEYNLVDSEGNIMGFPIFTPWYRSLDKAAIWWNYVHQWAKKPVRNIRYDENNSLIETPIVEENPQFLLPFVDDLVDFEWFHNSPNFDTQFPPNLVTDWHTVQPIQNNDNLNNNATLEKQVEGTFSIFTEHSKERSVSISTTSSTKIRTSTGGKQSTTVVNEVDSNTGAIIHTAIEVNTGGVNIGVESDSNNENNLHVKWVEPRANKLQESQLYGYKFAEYCDENGAKHPCIIKLKTLPDSTFAWSKYDSKLRVNKAEVVGIFPVNILYDTTKVRDMNWAVAIHELSDEMIYTKVVYDTSLSVKMAQSSVYIKRDANGNPENTFYVVGDVLSVSDFDDDENRECGAGINFYLVQEEALMWAGTPNIFSDQIEGYDYVLHFEGDEDNNNNNRK